MHQSDQPACPLCGNREKHAIVEAEDPRLFLLCPDCRLIHVPPAFHPDEAEARDCYLLHENGIGNPGYIDFLNRAIEPTLPFLPDHSEILDFGCGPSPTLSILLERNGHRCANYDPLFYPKPPEGPFDTVFATECFEHFAEPAKEMSHITSLLKPGGILTIMTILWISEERFRAWHYTRDKTHICFYHHHTIHYLCDSFGYEVAKSDYKRLFILRKNE